MGAGRSRLLPAARRARRRERLRRLGDGGHAGRQEAHDHEIVSSARASLVLPARASRGAFAQDTTGTIEGAVTDKTAGAVAGARVVARNLDTGFTKETDGRGGRLLPAAVAAGRPVQRHRHARRSSRRWSGKPIQVSVSQTVRVNAQLELRRSPRRSRSPAARSSSTPPATRSGASSPAASWSICRSTAATSRSSGCCRPASRRSPPASPRRAAACARARPTR